MKHIVYFCLVIGLVQASRYAVLLDATSQGTTASLYTYDHPFQSSAPVVQAVKLGGFPVVANQSMDLATLYQTSAPSVVGYITGLINQIKNSVPSDSWTTTVLMFKGRSGVRSMSAADQAGLLAMVNGALQGVGAFYSSNLVGVISEDQEAFYEWISVNALANTLGASTTAGVTSVDSDSAHFAFANSQGTFSLVNAGSVNYTVYGANFAGYGTSAILQTYRDYLANANLSAASCFPSGYSETYNGHNFVGTGISDDCMITLQSLLTLTPPPAFTGALYAFGDFVTVVQAYVDISKPVSLNDLSNAAITACSAAYTAGSSAFGCLNINFAFELLKDGFGLGLTQTVNIGANLASVPISYAVGYITYETNNLPLTPFIPSTTGYSVTTGVWNTTSNSTTPITTGTWSWSTAFANFDWAGHILAVFFGVLLLFIFVFIVVRSCYNDYNRLKEQTASNA